MIAIIHRSFRSSPDAYVNLIEKCARDRALHRGRALHAHLVTSGLACLTQIAAKLIFYYMETGKLIDARNVFDKIPRRNISRWVVMVGAYARRGYYQEALDVFSEMQREGLKHDRFMIPSLLKACGHLFDQETGEKIHCVVLKCSFDSDAFVVSALIDMYSKFGKVEKAKRVFNSLVQKDLVVLNAMVSGYVQHGYPENALNLVREITVNGLNPDQITWNTLIAGFSQIGDEAMMSEIFRLMQKNGFEPDVVSWTSAISGLAQNFQNDKAFDTFRQMLNHGLYPNSATISTLLPACANLANIKCGKEIHGYSVVIGVEDDVYVRSALVDMYAKCGFIFEAGVLFYKMPERNTVTFNSMIFGYASHGYSEEAVKLFNQMDIDGKNLDHLTFTAVLTACSHAGLTNIGKRLFLLMQEKYKIMPRLEHYACMVDLLGRAGKLVEAYDMIKGMPMEPDLFVWGALLGACRNHRNIDLAKIAAKHLSELEPTSAGNNLLLSGLYADAGSWGNVMRLKKMLKRKKLRKFPGCSWIETAA